MREGVFIIGTSFLNFCRSASPSAPWSLRTTLGQRERTRCSPFSTPFSLSSSSRLFRIRKQRFEQSWQKYLKYENGTNERLKLSMRRTNSLASHLSHKMILLVHTLIDKWSIISANFGKQPILKRSKKWGIWSNSSQTQWRPFCTIGECYISKTSQDQRPYFYWQTWYFLANLRALSLTSLTFPATSWPSCTRDQRETRSFDQRRRCKQKINVAGANLSRKS